MDQPAPPSLPPYDFPTVLDVYCFADLAMKVAHELAPGGQSLFALAPELQDQVWLKTTELMAHARHRLETRAFLERYLAAAPPHLPSVKTPPASPSAQADAETEARLAEEVREAMKDTLRLGQYL